MTNPNNAVGTNAAYSGRTSTNAFNDGVNAWTRGVLSGWLGASVSGMTIQVGGGNVRDVAIAADNAGNKTTVNNISGAPIQLTIDTAPATNKRIDSVVVYVDNPQQGQSTEVDNPGCCGIIVVKGTVASSPVRPTDAMIRTAITADGASGATAYFAIIANVAVDTGVTTINATKIAVGEYAQLTTTKLAANSVSATQLSNSAVTTAKINGGAVTAPKIDFTTFKSGNFSTSEQATEYTWVDGSIIYKKTVSTGALPNSTTKSVAHGITNLAFVIEAEGYAKNPTSNVYYPIPCTLNSAPLQIGLTLDNTNINIYTGSDRTVFTTSYVTVYYTKSN